MPRGGKRPNAGRPQKYAGSVNGGCSLYEVQRLLGHTSSKTTQRYAHLSQAALSDAMKIAGRHVLARPPTSLYFKKIGGGRRRYKLLNSLPPAGSTKRGVARPT